MYRCLTENVVFEYRWIYQFNVYFLFIYLYYTPPRVNCDRSLGKKRFKKVFRSKAFVIQDSSLSLLRSESRSGKCKGLVGRVFPLRKELCTCYDERSRFWHSKPDQSIKTLNKRNLT